MPLPHNKPNTDLMYELEEAAAAAAELIAAIQGANTPLPDSFPEAALDDLLAIGLGKHLLQRGVAIAADVVADPDRVDQVVVAEDRPRLALEEGDLLPLEERLVGHRVVKEQVLEHFSGEGRFDQPWNVRGLDLDVDQP